MNSRKIAISLPDSLLARVEESRRTTAESRSAFFRLAAEGLLRERALADRVAEYVDGYTRQPEGPGEIAAADAASAEVFEPEDWT